ncbi:MAG: hypothetical protein ACJ75H_17440 [Thermoanaerobaculia bacterium]
MKRKPILLLGAFALIAGALVASPKPLQAQLTPDQTQELFAETVGTCEGGWTIDCDGNVCCTVCQSTGAIGACKAAS